MNSFTYTQFFLVMFLFHLQFKNTKQDIVKVSVFSQIFLYKMLIIMKHHSYPSLLQKASIWNETLKL